jgi:salicylate hydroxylase
VYTQQNTFSNSVEPDMSAIPWKVRSRGLCVQGLKVGGMQAIANGQTLTVCNGVHGKLYWALSLTDESTDGHTKVRFKDCAESKARLIQEFEGWDLALKLVEVHLSTFLLCNA